MGKEGKMLVSDEFCCEMPWQRMFILADGVTTQCCGDLYQQFPLAQLALPSQIKEYSQRLEELVSPKHKPGDTLEIEVISTKNLEKHALGSLQEDGTIKATKMRVKGITGNVNIIPLTDSVEAIWTGKLSNHMREMNRRGCTHKINACADCGGRETVIRKMNLNYKIVSKKESKKKGKIKYLEEGLNNPKD